uniref:Uncharacterized protein n=1 Tax=viral metagenome TaxID=1070528 RepID=A0A6C0H7F8_9ZZZZ
MNTVIIPDIFIYDYDNYMSNYQNILDISYKYSIEANKNIISINENINKLQNKINILHNRLELIKTTKTNYYNIILKINERENNIKLIYLLLNKPINDLYKLAFPKIINLCEMINTITDSKNKYTNIYYHKYKWINIFNKCIYYINNVYNIITNKKTIYNYSLKILNLITQILNNGIFFNNNNPKYIILHYNNFYHLMNDACMEWYIKVIIYKHNIILHKDNLIEIILLDKYNNYYTNYYCNNNIKNDIRKCIKQCYSNNYLRFKI